MELSSHPGLLLIAYTAAPGTASHDSLQLLATWAATDASAAPRVTSEADAGPSA
jgi:hypothetical protein